MQAHDLTHFDHPQDQQVAAPRQAHQAVNPLASASPLPSDPQVPGPSYAAPAAPAAPFDAKAYWLDLAAKGKAIAAEREAAALSAAGQTSPRPGPCDTTEAQVRSVPSPTRLIAAFTFPQPKPGEENRAEIDADFRVGVKATMRDVHAAEAAQKAAATPAPATPAVAAPRMGMRR